MLNADEFVRFIEGFAQINECWVWQRSKDTSGYGAFRISGKRKYVHRISYELFKGEIPVNLQVRHTCDNPACANPKHLLLGTSQQNRDDCVERKRHNFGQKNGNAALTESQAREIRDLSLCGLFTLRYIGQQYRISAEAVHKIKIGRNWSHI